MQRSFAVMGEINVITANAQALISHSKDCPVLILHEVQAALHI